jgi:hypothetical protein
MTRLVLNKEEEEFVMDGLIGEAIKSLRDRAQVPLHVARAVVMLYVK